MIIVLPHTAADALHILPLYRASLVLLEVPGSPESGYQVIKSSEISYAYKQVITDRQAKALISLTMRMKETRL